MAEKLFGSSGIRQLYSRHLVELSYRVGRSMASSGNTIMMGRDTRTTSGIISHSLMSGILSAGGDVINGGIIPTPTVAYCTRDVNAGCMITASHNPEEYNGIKLINPNGSAFTSRQQREIEKEIDEEVHGDWCHQGHEREIDAVYAHSSMILKRVDIRNNLNVIIDCGNGAGSVITPDLLSSAGAKTQSINCNISGFFTRPSEPLESNLPYLSGLVRSSGADCAIIHDGDADRMMALDGTGRYISGDALMILFVRYLGSKKVVTTTDASMSIEAEAEVHRTPVGDSYVSEELIGWGDFGAEPSGSWIFPDVSLCPDGIYAAALFSEIASEWNISDELKTIPDYPVLRQSIRAEHSKEIMREIGADDPTYGIRVSDDDGWFMVRASGTEPKIRITAEGKDLRKAKEMLDAGMTLLKRAKRA